MIDTAIVILHYNNEEMTKKCISEVIKNTESGTYLIVVVDNNSEKLFNYFDAAGRVVVIRNSNNNSTSGMNFGFYYCLNNPKYLFKYIVNIDNDVFVLPNWLPPLVNKIESSEDIGIVGGKQWDEKQEFFRSVGMDMMGIIYKNHPDEDLDVIWIQGSFIMFRADMMRMIGLHDERYQHICSDCDYCIHALDRGYRVVFVTNSNVIHLGSASYNKIYPGGDDDRKAFVQKWFGLKFSLLSKKFPLSLQEKRSAYSELKVIENIKMEWEKHADNSSR